MALRWKLVAGIAAAAVAIPVAVTAATRSKVEEPRYEVVATEDAFEVRQYAPRIVAEVDLEYEDAKKATNIGFRILADYIFGNNEAQTKMAMTAPVDRTRSETIAMTAPVDRTRDGDRWTVAFTMPSKFTLETLPKPLDRRVRVRQIAKTRYAVMRFSGAPSERAVARKMEQLVAAVEEAGLATSGSAPTYARYDPPWTLPPLRRNEIFVELRTPMAGGE
jgi:hypothetical protein